MYKDLENKKNQLLFFKGNPDYQLEDFDCEGTYNKYKIINEVLSSDFFKNTNPIKSRPIRKLSYDYAHQILYKDVVIDLTETKEFKKYVDYQVNKVIDQKWWHPRKKHFFEVTKLPKENYLANKLATNVYNLANEKIQKIKEEQNKYFVQGR